MTEVFVVTHGEYSDYCVECVFEREEDAQAYVDLVNRADARRFHESAQNPPRDSPWWMKQQAAHAAPFADCEACKKSLADPTGSRAYRVERFAFHPAGEIPHGEAP